MDKVRLNPGVDMPRIGFGTWEIFKDTARQSVQTALETGYRLIDTAKIYSNEREVGEAIRRSGIPRQEIFVTTKLWNDDHGYDATVQACRAALERLGMDYIDLYLIHWPATSKRHASWDALIELSKQGLVRNIGVSNYTVEHLKQLMERSDTLPAVNQVEFHPFICDQQMELLHFCKQHGITVEAYSPLARLSQEKPAQVASIAEKHGKTPQQVVLRWCLQYGTIPLPRSTNPEHIRSNFDVFGFELDDEDMQTLNNMSDGERVTWDPAGMGR